MRKMFGSLLEMLLELIAVVRSLWSELTKQRKERRYAIMFRTLEFQLLVNTIIKRAHQQQPELLRKMNPDLVEELARL
jgi:hypothetical protein